LGAEKLPDNILGFAESAHNLTDAFGALQLRNTLDEFVSGRIIILACVLLRIRVRVLPESCEFVLLQIALTGNPAPIHSVMPFAR